MTLLIVYLALAIGVSFVCSVLEAVLLSITPAYVAEKANSDPGLGKRLQAFKAEIEKPLSAILSLNTIAHTVGAAGVGAQAAVVFANVPVGVISGVLTLLILVLSEIIPKTLGARYWRFLAPWVAPVLSIVIISMYPLVWMSKKIAKLLAGNESEHSISRAEFIALAELGASEGVFAAREAKLLRRLLAFKNVRARDVMTPRSVMFSLPTTMTVEQALAAHGPLKFSRIPIYQDVPGRVVGKILADDILHAAAQNDGQQPLQAFQRPIVSVPENQSMMRCFDVLMTQRAHLALVADEYGHVEGLLSLEDILETLLGLEIVDESDEMPDLRDKAKALADARREARGAEAATSTAPSDSA